MKFINPYFTTKDKIELLQRWLLVHGYIYYELNDNVIEDHLYDSNSMQLLRYINKYPKTFKRSRYYKAFIDFDGSTGFGLYEKLDLDDYVIIVDTAQFILKNFKRR